MFTVETDEGESGSHFDGSRGTQPGADGNISMHQQIRSLQITSMLAQDEGDAQHIVAPGTGALGGEMIDIEFEISGKLVGLNQQLAVRAARNRDQARKLNRGGHDETFVVIGMLADQVHAAGRAENSGRIPKALLKLPGKFAQVCQSGLSP
jgi:hypothetical protein